MIHEFFELHTDQFRRAAAPAVLMALVLFCQPALAQQPVNSQTWMSDESDYIANIPLKGIAMLGTHDSAMYIEPGYSDIAKTQVADFPGQLDRGVRWLDTRIVRLDASFTEPDGTSSCPAVTGAILPYPGPGYYLYGHGGPDRCIGVTLPTVLDQISQWLDQHPKEIIILELVGGQSRINTKGYSYTNPDVNDVNSEFAFLAVFDQHLRRASDNASYIYDRPTACALAGSQYTSTGLYQGACQGALIHPQEVTPQQLWTTSARVILLEQFSLDESLNAGIFPQFTWNDIIYQKSQEQPNERLTGYFSSGTIDPNILLGRLETGSTPDNNFGLYGYRPAYQSYEADGDFLTLQAELTPNGVGIDGNTVALGPVEDAGIFNPLLNSTLQTTWQPYSVNIVDIDRADDEAVLANVVAYNQQTFGRVPSGPPNPTQVVAGWDGNVYAVAGGTVWKRTAFTGQPTDWTSLGFSASRLAVSPFGTFVTIDSSGNIEVPNGSVIAPGIQFKDIAVGTDFALYGLSTTGNAYQISPTGLYSSTAFPIPGINNIVSIAAGPAGTLTAVDASGTVWRYTSNGNWSNLNNIPNNAPSDFLASSVTVDEAGTVWATERESSVSIIRRPLTSFVIPFSKVWSLVNGNWLKYREDGVQISAGASGTNGVEVVYALSRDGLLHSLRYSPSTGLGAQTRPPRRYAASVSVSGLTYNHATKLFTGTLTVTNNTASPITDQLAVVFQRLSRE